MHKPYHMPISCMARKSLCRINSGYGVWVYSFFRCQDFVSEKLNLQGKQTQQNENMKTMWSNWYHYSKLPDEYSQKDKQKKILCQWWQGILTFSLQVPRKWKKFKLILQCILQRWPIPFSCLKRLGMVMRRDDDLAYQAVDLHPAICMGDLKTNLTNSIKKQLHFEHINNSKNTLI